MVTTTVKWRLVRPAELRNIHHHQSANSVPNTPPKPNLVLATAKAAGIGLSVRIAGDARSKNTNLALTGARPAQEPALRIHVCSQG